MFELRINDFAQPADVGRFNEWAAEVSALLQRLSRVERASDAYGFPKATTEPNWEILSTPPETAIQTRLDSLNLRVRQHLAVGNAVPHNSTTNGYVGGFLDKVFTNIDNEVRGWQGTVRNTRTGADANYGGFGWDFFGVGAAVVCENMNLPGADANIRGQMKAFQGELYFKKPATAGPNYVVAQPAMGVVSALVEVNPAVTLNGDPTSGVGWAGYVVGEPNSLLKKWTANTVKFKGEQALPTAIAHPSTGAAHIHEATTVTGNQQTGAIEPAWNVVVGGTTTDNNVTWTNRGAITTPLNNISKGYGIWVKNLLNTAQVLNVTNAAAIKIDGVGNFGRLLFPGGGEIRPQPNANHTAATGVLEIDATDHVWFKQAARVYRKTNATTGLFVQAGDTLDQAGQLIFEDRIGTDRWAIEKNAANDFKITDVGAADRIVFTAIGNSAYRTGGNAHQHIFGRADGTNMATIQNDAVKLANGSHFEAGALAGDGYYVGATQIVTGGRSISNIVDITITGDLVLSTASKHVDSGNGALGGYYLGGSQMLRADTTNLRVTTGLLSSFGIEGLSFTITGTSFTWAFGGGINVNALDIGGTNIVTSGRALGNLTSAVVPATAGTLGFYGATAATKQTVTGSRGGNAALASLLTALNTLGLITDSSTA